MMMVARISMMIILLPQYLKNMTDDQHEVSAKVKIILFCLA